ncbi:MAG: M1 family metallopeptidase, partial [Nitrospiraceae bacterium]
LAVDSWKPEWRRWTTFGVSRAAALSVDGLHSSRPIEYPVRAPRDADAMFDVLTYEKGASVLRMLEQHLRPEVFRDGVREYLRAHAYDNADTGDLWAALGRAAKQPVPALMDGWIFRPGYPLLTVSLEPGSRLRITQQRFTYLPSSEVFPLSSPRSSEAPRRPPPKSEGGVGVNEHWQVPVQLRITAGGKTETKRLLLTEGEIKLTLPKDFASALLNEGGHGFYRVRYAPELLERLFKSFPNHPAAIERFNLVNDGWAAAIAGLLPLSEYLDMTARFRAERDKNVWAVLIESFQVLNRLIRPAQRHALESFVRDRVGPTFTELGWTARPDEDDLTRQLRGDLVRALGAIGNDTNVQAQAAELYAAHTRDVGAGRAGSLDPNLMPSLIAILAHVGDAARYEEFVKRFRSAATPQEERRYLYALAAFQPVSLLEQTLTMTLNGEIRTQDAPFLISASLMSVYGRDRAWRFVKANWDEMDRKFPKQGLRRMCGGIVGLATPELERDVRAFCEERKIDLGGRTLEQYLEELRIMVILRERDGTALSKYLEGFTNN